MVPVCDEVKLKEKTGENNGIIWISVSGCCVSEYRG